MTANSVKVFFYGSFMDLELLRDLGVVPRNFETAKLNHWDITFSPKATLVPSNGDRVYGLVADLSRTNVEKLYSRDDMKNYKLIETAVETNRNEHVIARCYISKPSTGQKPSIEYLQRVVNAAQKLHFPSSYLSKLQRTPVAHSE